jgi:hypothetical protein
MSSKPLFAAFVASLAAGLCSVAVCHADVAKAEASPADEFGKAPLLRAATEDEIRTQVAKWLDEAKVEPAVKAQALALWPAELAGESGTELLKRLAETFAVADPQARELVEFCSHPLDGVVVPEFAFLKDEGRPALVRNNLRLLLGRWFSQERLYEESLAQLGDLTPEQVVDPASLLFYQGVAHHRLLQKEPGLKTIRRLLDDVEGQPQRYVSVAGMMYEDLKALKDDSLDHVSRLMDDVNRRLDLGRTGPKVRKVEDDIVASLDKLIEEMEKQQQQQQGGGGAGSGSQRSSSPAQDSRILGGRGPGDVDRKNIGSKSGWGDLPPKQRQEALQQIGKDFPSHYREVIEQYFRKLAGDEPAR